MLDIQAPSNNDSFNSFFQLLEHRWLAQKIRFAMNAVILVPKCHEVIVIYLFHIQNEIVTFSGKYKLSLMLKLIPENLVWNIIIRDYNQDIENSAERKTQHMDPNWRVLWQIMRILWARFSYTFILFDNKPIQQLNKLVIFNDNVA